MPCTLPKAGAKDLQGCAHSFHQHLEGCALEGLRLRGALEEPFQDNVSLREGAPHLQTSTRNSALEVP